MRSVKSVRLLIVRRTIIISVISVNFCVNLSRLAEVFDDEFDFAAGVAMGVGR